MRNCRASIPTSAPASLIATSRGKFVEIESASACCDRVGRPAAAIHAGRSAECRGRPRRRWARSDTPTGPARAIHPGEALASLERGHPSWAGRRAGREQAIVLHRRTEVVALVAKDPAVRIETDSDRRIHGGYGRPLHVFRAHPLHANRPANCLREQHRLVFSSCVAAIRPAVVARSRVGPDNHLVHRNVEHDRNALAEELRILGIRVHGDRAVGTNIGERHGRPNGCVLQVRNS